MTILARLSNHISVTCPYLPDVTSASEAAEAISRFTSVQGTTDDLVAQAGSFVPDVAYTFASASGGVFSTKPRTHLLLDGLDNNDGHLGVARQFTHSGTLQLASVHSLIVLLGKNADIQFKFKDSDRPIVDTPVEEFIAGLRSRHLVKNIGDCFTAMARELATMPTITTRAFIIEDVIDAYRKSGAKGIRVLLGEELLGHRRPETADQLGPYQARLALQGRYREKYSNIVDIIESYLTEADYYRLFEMRLRTLVDTLKLEEDERNVDLVALINEFYKKPSEELLGKIRERFKGQEITAGGIMRVVARKARAEIREFENLYLQYESEKGKTLADVLNASFPGKGEKIAKEFAPITEDIVRMREVRHYFPSPTGDNAPNVEQVGRRIAATVSRHFAGMAEGPVWQGISQRELRDLLDASPIGQKLSFEQLMQLYESVIGKYNMHFGHPRFVGQMHPAGTTISLFAESLIATLQENLIVREVSPSTSAVEDQLERWLCGLMGYGDTRDDSALVRPAATFTTGGTTANMTALLIARNQWIDQALKDRGVRNATVKKDGLLVAAQKLREAGGPGRFYFVGSVAAHYSMGKIASILGLGESSFIRISADDHAHIKLLELERFFKWSKKRGHAVMSVIANLGTTETGNVDPISQIMDIAAEYGARVHVDGAWGAPFMMVSRIRDTLFRGIERANSITVDPHKMLHMPYSLGAAVFRDREELHQLSSGAAYLFDKDERVRAALAGSASSLPDFRHLGQSSLLGSRRADSLKLFMTLKLMGPEAYETLFEHSLDMTRYWEAAVKRRSDMLEPLSHPELNLLCFRYVPPQLRKLLKKIQALQRKRNISDDQATEMLARINAELNLLNQSIQERMLNDGHSYIAYDDLNTTPYADGKADSPAGLDL